VVLTSLVTRLNGDSLHSLYSFFRYPQAPLTLSQIAFPHYRPDPPLARHVHTEGPMRRARVGSVAPTDHALPKRWSGGSWQVRGATNGGQGAMVIRSGQRWGGGGGHGKCDVGCARLHDLKFSCVLNILS
jgi:hypothetical protein